MLSHRWLVYTLALSAALPLAAEQLEATPTTPFAPGKPIPTAPSTAFGAGAGDAAVYLEGSAVVPIDERSAMEGGSWALAGSEIARGAWLGVDYTLIDGPGLRLWSKTLVLASTASLSAPSHLSIATGIGATVALPHGALRPYAFIESGGATFSAVTGASYTLRMAPETHLLLAGGLGVRQGPDGGLSASSAYALAAVEVPYKRWLIQVGAGVRAGTAMPGVLAPTYLDSEHLFPSHAARQREEAQELSATPFLFAQVRPRNLDS